MKSVAVGFSKKYYKIPDNFVKVGDFQYLPKDALPLSYQNKAMQDQLMELEAKNFEDLTNNEKAMIVVMQREIINN